MSQCDENPDRTGPEEISGELNRIFAQVERQGVRLTLVGVLITYFLYVSGWVEAFIPADRLSGMIGRGVETFVREHQAPTGWRWLAMLRFSDMLTLGALMLVVGVIFVAYAMVIPALSRRRDFLYLALVLIQLALFAIAGWGGPGEY